HDRLRRRRARAPPAHVRVRRRAREAAPRGARDRARRRHGHGDPRDPPLVHGPPLVTIPPMSEHNGDRARQGYVLFAWSPSGYTLRELDGDPPPVGEELADGGRVLVVTKI